MKKWEKPELNNLEISKTYDDYNTCYCDAGELQAISDESLRKGPGAGGQGGHHHRPGNPCPNKPHHKPHCNCNHCKPTCS